MIDPSKHEVEAMHSVLSPLGDYVATVGMDKPLSAYSKEQVLQMINVVVTHYHQELQKRTANDYLLEADDIPF